MFKHPIPYISNLVGGLFLTFLICSCSQQSAHRTYVVALSQCSLDDVWRKSMLRELKIEFEPYDSIQLIVKGADNRSDLQIRQIDSLINQQVDLLIISPLTGKELTPIATKAYQRGIPTIITDRKIEGDQFSCFIGADNYAIGLNAGNYVVQNAKSGAHVLEVVGLHSSSPATERNAGFRQALTSRPDIKLTTRKGDWIYQNTKEMLARDTTINNIDMVFCHNDMMAIAAYEVLHDTVSARHSSTQFIGVDAAPGAGLEAVADGKIKVSFRYPTGAHAIVQTALKLLSGQEVSKNIRLESSLVDAPIARSLLTQSGETDRYQKRIVWQKNHLEDLKNRFSFLRNTTLIIVILFVIVAVMLIYVWRMNRRIRYFNRELSIKNKHEQEQNKKLIALNTQVQHATAQKLQFFTNISHEIRTPLTLIIGPLNRLIRLMADSPLLPDLDIMHKNTLRLLRMINQVLDFRRLENDKQEIQVEEIDLVEFIPEIMSYFDHLAKVRKINYTFEKKEVSYKVWIDRDLIEKVIVNLLSNAFKFTPEEGSIDICLYREKTSIYLKVSDSGIGIEKDKLPHLFERFYTDNTSSATSSGIGLYLVQQYMQLHGGTVDVTSEKDKGTTLLLNFRIGKEHLLGPHIHEVNINMHSYVETVLDDKVEEKLIHHEYPYTILIVDDDNDMLEYLEHELKENFTLLLAHNGQEAFEILKKEEDISLILSDVMMPKMNGFELCKKVKENAETSHIVVVLLTALSNIRQQIYGVVGGADTYVCKPFHINYLKIKIIRLLEERTRMRDELQKRIDQGEMKPLYKIDKAGIDDVFLKRFMDHLEEVYQKEDYNIEQLSIDLNISRGHLYRKMKTLTGHAPVELLRNFRLSKGAELLTQRDCNVNEIAYNIGFSSPAYFSKCFKAVYKMNPSEYAKKSSCPHA